MRRCSRTANTVEIAALDDTTAPYSIFYLDSITLAYRSRYRVTGYRLAFEAAANRVIRVTGFSTPDILLFDVTRPQRPVRVTAKAFADGEGGWGVSITPRSPNGRYQALTRQAAALPRASAPSCDAFHGRAVTARMAGNPFCPTMSW